MVAAAPTAVVPVLLLPPVKLTVLALALPAQTVLVVFVETCLITVVVLLLAVPAQATMSALQLVHVIVSQQPPVLLKVATAVKLAMVAMP